MRLTPLVLLLALTACEGVDQFGHFAWGYARTQAEMRGGSGPREAQARTMLFAVEREQRQHEGCHAGCRRDLLFWLAGTEMGLLGKPAVEREGEGR